MDREVKRQKHLSNKAPFQTIKGLFKVNLDNHIPHRSFLVTEAIHYFLYNNHIINSATSRDEASLEGVDEIVQHWSEAINKEFCNKFVNGVAKANRSELINGFRVFGLRDETDEGFVEVRRHLT